MSQRLFNVPKVGVFVDSYGPGVEKRGGQEQSVLKVKFRIQPFDAPLASGLDAGVGEDSNVKATIFNLTTGEPKQKFTRHDFALGLARQNLEVFASPDTNASRVSLLQARISNTYVRTQKDMNALALIFVASFGPVGKDELELIHSLHRLQTWITFHESEPLLVEADPDEDDEDMTDEDEKAQRPAPIFDDQGEEVPAAAAQLEGETAREVGSRHKLHSHQTKKRTGRRRKNDTTDGDDTETASA